MTIKTTVILGVTAALLAACGTATSPSTLDAQATVSTMKTAEASGRIAAWASGRIAAWARGMDTSTLPDGRANTFAENLPAWRQVRLAEAQALAPRLGQGVVVAVVDTGLDVTHPAFAGRLTPAGTWYDFVGRDADPTDVPTAKNTMYGHGTAVAGVVLQLAPNATILPVRAMNADGTGTSAGLAEAVNWAVARGAHVINVSAVSGVDTALTTAIANATSKGVYVTLAAGNEGVNHVSYPARNSVQDNTLGQYAINAGAVNTDHTLAGFSNYGSTLEVVAPGVNVATAIPGGGYALATGTSFATPVLSGALALALGEPYKRAYAGQLARQLGATAVNINAQNAALLKGNSAPLGSGLVNLQAFMQSVR